MEITWHGNTCFTCREKGGLALAINPDPNAGKIKAEVVLASNEGKLPEVEGMKKVFDWPGEYEINDIPIVGFPAWTKSRTKEEESGKGEKTIIFCFIVDGIKICHLGELGHVLTSDMVKEIGDVDVLMIKVGKNSNLDIKKAVEIIEAIEPRVVIPMGEESSGESLLKEIGGGKTEVQDKFVLKSASELPEDQMKCVVLNKA